MRDDDSGKTGTGFIVHRLAGHARISFMLRRWAWPFHTASKGENPTAGFHCRYALLTWMAIHQLPTVR